MTHKNFFKAARRLRKQRKVRVTPEQADRFADEREEPLSEEDFAKLVEENPKIYKWVDEE